MTSKDNADAGGKEKEEPCIISSQLISMSGKDPESQTPDSAGH